ncbi:endonuclease/exonuclease/phosphatase family protein [Bauldia litoralis]|uniref:Endonuclease/Exonuclease/phosphatase family protein n=1 Tax=Bauldia litoralis TaxID=665467 RepID=A0A1G6AKV0_9HYPH|nr:endonuclease/exonuclease/phosphatase family protein [Bauldia litoralis]SDB09042.1 Endonuclease/Exonuclease/phosphatase family protein [Bauldia litoralis]
MTTKLSFATFNLYNLNEPGLPLYKNSRPWTNEEYSRKIAFTSSMLRLMKADVFGFQELWHAASLRRTLAEAGVEHDYEPLVPDGHAGGRIVCAAAVRKDILVGEPEWITSFPDIFRLSSGGDDAQTSGISVNISSFSRPVLHLTIRPRDDTEEIHVYICHFKSKGPTWISSEPWYDRDIYSKHSEAIGAAISTVRRTAEATALRMILTERMKGTNTPVVVLGDVNDGLLSNTLNILTGQPNYLTGFSTGGGDADLYTAQTLQEYRSTRDVYYTHVFQNERESLDQILFSQEFYDNSRKRIWAFEGLEVNNDHLNFEDHREIGSNDHGVVRARFKYDPVVTS